MVFRLKSIFTSLIDAFLDLIYNQKCLVCNCSKANTLLCKTCAKDVHYLSVYAHRIYKGVGIYSMAIYRGSVKKLIQLLKFSHRKKAAKVLAELLFEYFKKLDLKEDFIIIYPPSFYLKTMSRGYNHMFLIVKEFSKLSGLKYNSNIIKKIKYTKPQYRARNRKKNIEGSFEILSKEILINNLQNKPFLIIDDITTSGATIEEIINCLILNKITNIKVLTIAKV